MSDDGLRATIRRPSALTEAERAAWAAMMAETPHLRRAFFSHGFALACEEATGLARAALIRNREGALVAILPFQFPDARSRLLGVAERVGGGISDHCGLIARPGTRIAPGRLAALAGVGVLFFDHLSDGQDSFGLVASEARPGHVIELPDGAAAYFAWLGSTNKSFLQDTERRLRRLEKEFGPPQFSLTMNPAIASVDELLEAKRAQYARTGASDSLAGHGRLRIIRALVETKRPDCTPVLTTLAAGGRVLARHLGLLHAGNLSYWFPVYDPDARKVSPGRMLLWHTLQQADAHGIRLIDRGEGDSQAKRDFATGQRQFGILNMRAPGWRGLLARAAQSLAWRLRR